MIFSLTGQGGLGDFRRFWRLERIQGDIPALSSRPDIFLSFDLPFPSMIEGKVESKTAFRPAQPKRKFLSADNKRRIKYPVLVMGIPYEAIGIGLGLLLGIWAFIEADRIKGRVFIVATMTFLFFLPVVWRRPASSLVSFIGWIVFGISCYIFLKWRGAGLP